MTKTQCPICGRGFRGDEGVRVHASAKHPKHLVFPDGRFVLRRDLADELSIADRMIEAQLQQAMGGPGVGAADTDHDEYEYEDDWDHTGGPGSEGCYNCDGGWNHGCCDDLCRGCNEAFDCDNPRACPLCNRDGGYMPI